MGDPKERTVPGATDRHNGPPDERRQSPRHRLRDARGIMSWDEGPEHVACEVEVLNISGGGAAVVAERAPAVGLTVRLALEGRATVREPVEARALAVAVDPSGKSSVRLQFTHWVSLDQILERFHERRLWQRFPTRETRARLTWFENGSEKKCRGELLNISGGGAAIIMDVICPADEAIWFELEADGTELEPIESRLVVNSLDASGSQIVRIKFIDPCPIRVFEVAIHGAT